MYIALHIGIQYGVYSWIKNTVRLRIAGSKIQCGCVYLDQQYSEAVYSWIKNTFQLCIAVSKIQCGCVAGSKIQCSCVNCADDNQF